MIIIVSYFIMFYILYFLSFRNVVVVKMCNLKDLQTASSCEHGSFKNVIEGQTMHGSRLTESSVRAEEERKWRRHLVGNTVSRSVRIRC